MSNNGTPNGLDDFLENFNDINAQNTFSDADVKKNSAIAAIVYLLPILFFLPICIDGNSNYCKFHANQSLTWLIVVVILSIIFAILGMIPFIGGLFRLIFVLLVLAIDFGFIYGSVKGKALRLPYIGSILNVF
ncbi:hypothetical protein [Ruminococcus flavefaciens]|uniref:hypothetical protein n=1 Tax=Ruminococcus flavefaciens TaxID=1265 RepID=UPI0026ED9CFD|nr:hypothetical protein [Ruminococcus flavefaciens]